MFELLFSLPGPLALGLAGALLAVVTVSLRGNWRFLVIFGIFFVCRAAICAQFQLLFTGGGTLAAVLGSFADFVFLAPLLFLQPGRKRLFLTMISSTFVVAANIADTGYLLESGFRLQYMLFENLDLTAVLVRWEYALFTVLGAAALLFLFYVLFFRLRSGMVGRRQAKLLTALSAAVFISGFIEAPPVRALTDAVQNARPKAMLGVVADSAIRNFFMDAIRPAPNLTMEEQKYTDGERRFLAAVGLAGPVQKYDGSNATAYDRVICVFIESLSKSFALGPEKLRLPASGAQAGAEAAARSAMPFLASLLEDGRHVSIDGYHSSAFSTNDAIYAALASRPDFGGDSLAGRSMETVFSMALAKGWRTAFFLGSSGKFGHLDRNYKRLLKVESVFDRDSDFGLPPVKEYSQWGETDDRVFEKALAWMKMRASEKYVIAMSTIDTHPPFYAKGAPPPGFADTPLTRALYFTDTALAGFVTAFEKEGLLDELTLLVVTADHQITHGGRSVIDALPDGDFGGRSIPLVFMSGDTAPLRDMTNPALCSAVDLAPTLGDLLGFPAQPGYYGKSLFVERGHYDLALSRDGTLSFRTWEEPLIFFRLAAPPKDGRERALRKWYFNRQQGYPRSERE